MAVFTSAVTVTTSATLLLSRDFNRRTALVHVPTGGSTVYIGGDDVTTANGIPLEAGQTLALGQGDTTDQSPRYAYYGIVAASTQGVRVMRVDG